MRHSLGLLLVVVAACLSAPQLPRAFAYLTGLVALPASNQAQYQTVDSAGAKLLTCTVPSAIVLKKNTNISRPHFSCENNFGTPLTLYWAVVDDGAGTFLTIAAGTNTPLGVGSTGCRFVPLAAGATTETRPVVFQGVTDASSGMYAEIYFTGSVTVQNPGTGLRDGCP